MCSESLPKEFEKTSEVLPLSTYGLATVENFRRAEEKLQHLEWLKKAGLSNDELKLYQDNEGGRLENRTLIESSVLKTQLEVIYNKINTYERQPGCSKPWKDTPNKKSDDIIDKFQNKPMAFYPEGHPMNELKELEESLFGHLRDEALPLTKRRKIMRRLERKRERIMAQENQIAFEDNADVQALNRPGSLWDVKEVVGRPNQEELSTERSDSQNSCMIGPRNPTMYTIRDNRIVRLEPVDREQEEYRAVDIVMPVNRAEEELLEGTKMPLEDIMKIERFKDYEPGIPSKVLYLKNIAPSVSQEQLSLLFNQFVLDNGGPIDVRLMSGRMRGQAFVAFQSENLAIQALDEVNGTILSGQPIIAQFGRNSNRIQIDENR